MIVDTVNSSDIGGGSDKLTRTRLVKAQGEEKIESHAAFKWISHLAYQLDSIPITSGHSRQIAVKGSLPRELIGSQHERLVTNSLV